jgi:hypothetical protein
MKVYSISLLSKSFDFAHLCKKELILPTSLYKLSDGWFVSSSRWKWMQPPVSLSIIFNFHTEQNWHHQSLIRLLYDSETHITRLCWVRDGWTIIGSQAVQWDSVYLSASATLRQLPFVSHSSGMLCTSPVVKLPSKFPVFIAVLT